MLDFAKKDSNARQTQDTTNLSALLSCTLCIAGPAHRLFISLPKGASTKITLPALVKV